jgi:two-component system response regulator FixJ
MQDADGEAIFIVDDDPSVRDALTVVLALEGFKVTSFSEGASLLDATRRQMPACIMLDVHMPGRSGLDILKDLNAHSSGLPIFIISGQADIPMAVDAIRYGALDFIEKPFNADFIVSRVRQAIDARERRQENAASNPLAPNFPGGHLLTPRERQVLTQIAGGASNKETGRRLAISPRTVEVHRARIMEKLHARNAADLMRIVLADLRRH